MSEKDNKVYRYVLRELERNALQHYKNLSLLQKLKWGFNKKKYVKSFCDEYKMYNPYLRNRR